MERRFGTRPALIKGGGGIFEVKLDGELIFSKKQTGRFPAPGEVEATIAERIRPAGSSEG